LPPEYRPFTPFSFFETHCQGTSARIYVTDISRNNSYMY
jgi:hypothetical protein